MCGGRGRYQSLDNFGNYLYLHVVDTKVHFVSRCTLLIHCVSRQCMLRQDRVPVHVDTRQSMLMHQDTRCILIQDSLSSKCIKMSIVA